MAYLIGTDEAGYGPNLGPLVISATLWELPDGLLDADLYDVLSDAVAPNARAAAGQDLPVFADSKAVYRAGDSLALLERGVLALLAAVERQPASWREGFETLDGGGSAVRARMPWYRDFDLPLPLCAEPSRVAADAERLRRAMSNAGVSLRHVRSRVVYVPEFNEMLDRYGSKGSVLSLATLELVADSLEGIPQGPIRVLCDKHGGRNKYAGLLQDMARPGLPQVVIESRAESRYLFGPPSRRVDIRFSAKGERFLPSAVASMTSKYLRELAMLALNRYWCERVSGLRPTAGYPSDAKRWRAALKASEDKLQLDERLLWRSR
jgi:ribonuclease HII